MLSKLGVGGRRQLAVAVAVPSLLARQAAARMVSLAAAAVIDVVAVDIVRRAFFKSELEIGFCRFLDRFHASIDNDGGIVQLQLDGDVYIKMGRKSVPTGLLLVRRNLSQQQG